MLDKNKIAQLIEEHLADSPLFLVELKVSGRNQIGVYIDGDDGVPISSCVELSRHIESNFDREVEDYELEVSSVGISRPLALPRQFVKNVGREVEFTVAGDKKIKGKLIAADENGFTVEKQLPKKKKKDKTEQEEPIQMFPYGEARDVKIQVSFKSEE